MLSLNFAEIDILTSLRGHRRVDHINDDMPINRDVHVTPPAAASSESLPTESVEVSVVIPCLNEAKSLEFCIRKARSAFESADIRGEVVVADNGSTDGSVEIATALGARVIQVKNKGYGAALTGGIAAARGEFIIMGDGDDSYDFSAVPEFVRKWREGYDVVMGNRFRGEIKTGAMPWSHKYIGNPGFTALINLFFRTGFGDCLCGMRGFARAAYDRLDLQCAGMEWAPEFDIEAALADLRMTEIPIVLWPDKRGRPPHLRRFIDGWLTLRFILSKAAETFSTRWMAAQKPHASRSFLPKVNSERTDGE